MRYNKQKRHIDCVHDVQDPNSHAHYRQRRLTVQLEATASSRFVLIFLRPGIPSFSSLFPGLLFATHQPTLCAAYFIAGEITLPYAFGIAIEYLVDQ